MTNNYTKTVWVDGSAPAISASNLGNIEDGVYDAHEGQLDRPIYRGGLYLGAQHEALVNTVNTESGSWVYNGSWKVFFVEKAEANSDILIAGEASCYMNRGENSGGGYTNGTYYGSTHAWGFKFGAMTETEDPNIYWSRGYHNWAGDHEGFYSAKLFKASDIDDLQTTGRLKIYPLVRAQAGRHYYTDDGDWCSINVWEVPAGSSPDINANS